MNSVVPAHQFLIFLVARQCVCSMEIIMFATEMRVWVNVRVKQSSYALHVICE